MRTRAPRPPACWPQMVSSLRVRAAAWAPSTPCKRASQRGSPTTSPSSTGGCRGSTAWRQIRRIRAAHGAAAGVRLGHRLWTRRGAASRGSGWPERDPGETGKPVGPLRRPHARSGRGACRIRRIAQRCGASLEVARFEDPLGRGQRDESRGRSRAAGRGRRLGRRRRRRGRRRGTPQGPGIRSRPDGPADAGDGRLGGDPDHPPRSGLGGSSDRRDDGQCHGERSPSVSRRRHERSHRQAGRTRGSCTRSSASWANRTRHAGVLHDAGVAVALRIAPLRRVRRTI